MLRRWMPSEDIAVRLADALDAEDGGRRLLELARRLGRTEAAVRQRACACGPPGSRRRICWSSPPASASNKRMAVQVVAVGRSTGVEGLPASDDWNTWDAGEMQTAVDYLRRKRGLTR